MNSIESLQKEITALTTALGHLRAAQEIAEAEGAESVAEACDNAMKAIEKAMEVALHCGRVYSK